MPYVKLNNEIAPRRLQWDEIHALDLYTKTQAKAQRFVLEKKPVGHYHGQRDTILLYKKIGDKPPLSDARRAALTRARDLIGTSICTSCNERKDSDYFFDGYCLDCHFFNARIDAVKKARALLTEDPIFLDTETTGLMASDEIIEIAICDLNGNVLLESFVKPLKPIPANATAIHCINDAMVSSAPGWPEVFEQVLNLVYKRKVVIYNADFDRGMMFANCTLHRVKNDAIRDIEISCAMQLMSQFVGEWHSYYKTFRWQKLQAAAEIFGYRSDDKAHRALADCRATAFVLKKLAEQAI